jgi:DNA excision repair protein ERCC-2
VRPRAPHIPDPLLQLVCLDAGLAIRPVFEKYASVILTSGTLSPLDMYPRMLDFRPVVSRSLSMSIERQNILPCVVSRASDQTQLSSKFERREDGGVVAGYGRLLVDVCASVPDGVIAFFVSYSYMESMVSAWSASGILKELEANKLIFMETKDVVETSLALTAYRTACDAGRGALLFSIARGKVAEGIDFDRHYGRAVLLFGIPFQYVLSVVLRARMAYLRDTHHVAERDYMNFDALRQAAQCCGRIIRSKRDYGIIVFADHRYGDADKLHKLPAWIQQFLPASKLNLSSDRAVALMRKFLREMAQPEAPLPPGQQSRTLMSLADIEAWNAGQAEAVGGGFLSLGGTLHHPGAGTQRLLLALGPGATLAENGQVRLRATGGGALTGVEGVGGGGGGGAGAEAASAAAVAAVEGEEEEDIDIISVPSSGAEGEGSSSAQAAKRARTG